MGCESGDKLSKIGGPENDELIVVPDGMLHTKPGSSEPRVPVQAGDAVSRKYPAHPETRNLHFIVSYLDLSEWPRRIEREDGPCADADATGLFKWRCHFHMAAFAERCLGCLNAAEKFQGRENVVDWGCHRKTIGV